MKPVYEYTIKLLRYVLNGDVPNIPENIDYRELYDFSASHSVENMIYVALSELKMPVPEDIMLEFEDSYYRAVEAEALQSIELEAISETFEEAGIDFMPLKGSVIKHLYPMPDYRKCGDIDILVKPEQFSSVRDILLGMSFVCKRYNEHEIHDTYYKEPYIMVEVHRKLISKKNAAYKFCNDVWNYSYANDEHKCFFMEDEFLLAYSILHIYKHLSKGGIGIKHITDLYIIQSKLHIDYKKLYSYLDKTDMLDIYIMFNNIVMNWFGDGKLLSQDEQVVQDVVFVSGCFGTKELKDITYRSKKNILKLIDFFRYVFVPIGKLKREFVFLEKYPYLLPVVWIYRTIYKIIFRNKQIIRWVKKSFFCKDNQYAEFMGIIQNRK